MNGRSVERDAYAVRCSVDSGEVGAAEKLAFKSSTFLWLTQGKNVP